MSPDVVPWGDYYPELCGGGTCILTHSSHPFDQGMISVVSAVSYADQPKVEMADVGCGYGGLLSKRALWHEIITLVSTVTTSVISR